MTLVPETLLAGEFLGWSIRVHAFTLTLIFVPGLQRQITIVNGVDALICTLGVVFDSDSSDFVIFQEKMDLDL